MWTEKEAMIMSSVLRNIQKTSQRQSGGDIEKQKEY